MQKHSHCVGRTHTCPPISCNYTMKNNNRLDPALVQLAQSSMELREELDCEVEIATTMKKIRKLIQNVRGN